MADDNRYSINYQTGDGSQTVWSFNFAGGYLDRSHVKARLVGSAGLAAALSFAWISDTSIKIEPAVGAGVKFAIYRDTPKAQPLANFANGAVLTERNLDLNARQAVLIAAEALDAALVATQGPTGERGPSGDLRTRAAPSTVFESIPFTPTLTASGVKTSETPLAFAKRTRTVTNPSEALYVEANGDDVTGSGTIGAPFRTIQKALETTGSTRIRVGAGQYPPFSLRRDTYPNIFNRLRIIEARGAVTIAWPADDMAAATWVAGPFSTWSTSLTAGNKPPRAVIDLSRVDPDTGLGTPLVRYANSRSFTFGGQPLNGQTVAVNGIVFTFKNTVSGSRDVAIGSNAAATANNLLTKINAESYACGVLADTLQGSAVVRIMARIDADQNVTASASGSQPAVSGLVSGLDALGSLSLTPNPNISPSSPLADAGGWYHDAAANKLHVRIRSESIQAYRANLRLITSTSDGSSKCFVYGAQLGLDGDIQFEGTYLWLLDQGGNRPEVWAEFKNPRGRAAGFCTTVNVGLIENDGGLAVISGARGVCSHLDTFHLNTATFAPTTVLMHCASAFAGDQYTFPVTDFPNKNGLSAHGPASITAAFSFRSIKSNGPEVAGEGNYWLVDCDLGDCAGLGNEYGILAILGSSYYVDSCNVHGNVLADIGASGNSSVRVFNSSYRTAVKTDGTGSIDLTWTP